MAELGTLEDLPVDYREDLTALNLVPLWPSLRAVLPYEKPARNTRPVLWRYKDIRPLLLKAGELTPIEKAERRVLALGNPGLGLDNMMATPTIYIGMQLIQPGETAPCHKHTPSAIRCVVEGAGGFTTVEGEKCPMEKGDLILTPSGTWHEHGHEGSGPVVWMDALDLPLVYYLESSYCIEGDSQPLSNRPDGSQTRYRRAGLVPYKSLGRARAPYPLYRYPWVEVREALLALEADTAADDIVWLAYVNPETGAECLPTLGFSAVMLRPGETARPNRRSASAVIHVIEGSGEAVIDDAEMSWEEDDTFSVPTHAEVTLSNRSARDPAFLFVVDDAPVQRKMLFYEEFPRA
ncbi:MAG: cupin domain-containing protein [Alphaproteobacteria bacterium]|nr:cupin domain-containing protein [Alphaproteobacteria bacterium]